MAFYMQHATINKAELNNNENCTSFSSVNSYSRDSFYVMDVFYFQGALRYNVNYSDYFLLSYVSYIHEKIIIYLLLREFLLVC